MQDPAAIGRDWGISRYKIPIIVGIVVLVVVGAAAFFVLSFKPPVDISKAPHLSSSLDPQTLFPQQLAGQNLDSALDDVSGYNDLSYKGSYSIFTVVIGKADSAVEASRIIRDESQSFEGVSGSHATAGNWFTYDGSGSELGWSDGQWFFIISADDGGTRNLAAQGLIDFMNQHG